MPSVNAMPVCKTSTSTHAHDMPCKPEPQTCAFSLAPLAVDIFQSLLRCRLQQTFQSSKLCVTSPKSPESGVLLGKC